MPPRLARHDRANGAAKNRALHAMADALAASRDELKAANEKTGRGPGQWLEPALLDRLALSDKTLGLMAEGLRQIAALPDPSVASPPLRCAPMACASRRCACRWA